MKQIEFFCKGTHTIEVLTHYNTTEEFCEFLKKIGRNIVSISYGYYNQLDLIVYEV